MKPALLFSVFAPMVLMPALIWFYQTGDLSVYFNGAAPPGQFAYVISKERLIN